MLYARRKRQEELARREAAGESLWSVSFDDAARARLVHVMQSVGPTEAWTIELLQAVHQLICAELGIFHLGGAREWVELHAPEKDLIAAVLGAEPDMVATIIEAVWQTVANEHGADRTSNPFLGAYEDTVATILAEHRVAFELVDGQMVPFTSREMHVEVVEPTLRLFGGREGWDGVERAYRKALEEIGTDPGDAITDAGTALQEALTMLGCAGGSLGPLATSAIETGLLTGHDRKLVDWVNADRSKTGDAHNATPATPGDAWLAVHVVGALLLRLAADEPRG